MGKKKPPVSKKLVTNLGKILHTTGQTSPQSDRINESAMAIVRENVARVVAPNAHLGNGVGVGHTSNTPNLPKIEELDPATLTTAMQAHMVLNMPPGSRVFRMGELSIFLSPPYQQVGWIMSIAHPYRLPTWDEIMAARNALLPMDRPFVMHMPTQEEYVNLHNFCFQVQEPFTFADRNELGQVVHLAWEAFMKATRPDETVPTYEETSVWSKEVDRIIGETVQKYLARKLKIPFELTTQALEQQA